MTFGTEAAKASGLAIALLLISMQVSAQESEGSFLSDYSGLRPAEDGSVDRLYIATDSLARLASYKSVMVDQPEIFIHPDSKYRGMKPDDMKRLADGLRAAVINELKDGYQIVDAPGPGILYIRMAAGDLYLKKHKQSLLSHTIDVTKMTIEAEILDSQSLDQLAALTTTRGSLDPKEKVQATSWEEMSGLFGVLGKRLRCRLDNSGKPESEWPACSAINLPPPASN